MSTTLFDPVKTGRDIDDAWKEYCLAEKRIDDAKQQRTQAKGSLIARLQHARDHVADFKAYLKEHTHIGRSTAYRMLALTDGRGDEVRASERARQQKSRAVSVTTPVTDTPEAPTLIPDPPTPAEAVELAASQGATMTEPEAAECLRLARLPEGDFENEVEAPAIVPEPAGASHVTPSTTPGTVPELVKQCKGRLGGDEIEAAPEFAAKIKPIWQGKTKNHPAASRAKLDQFKIACDALLGSMTEADLLEACDVMSVVGDLRFEVENEARQAKEAVETAKRVKRAAKNPETALEQARESAQYDEMDFSGELDEAKQDAKDNDERWADVKDERIAQWVTDNWDEDREGEFKRDFLADWGRNHGKPFPASNCGGAL